VDGTLIADEQKCESVEKCIQQEVEETERREKD
jgi:hypothetical protein